MFMFPQDKGKLLGANTVAYLNVDSGVSGMRCIKVAMYIIPYIRGYKSTASKTL